MTYKQIEASREARLWITQVIIPAASVAAVAFTIPEFREAAGAKIKNLKDKIKSKTFKR